MSGLTFDATCLPCALNAVLSWMPVAATINHNGMPSQ